MSLICNGCGQTARDDDDTYPVEIDGVTVTCCLCGVALSVEMTAEGIAAYLRDRPAVWLAVLRSMPQEVLGPWQANDRSKPPVPETVQRVRYGVGIVSVVWDRGEAFALRWRWRCGSGMGDAATRQEAEAAADQHARDRGVMLVDT